MKARNLEGKTSAGCRMRMVGLQVWRSSSGRTVWFPGDHVAAPPITPGNGVLDISCRRIDWKSNEGERNVAKAEGSMMNSPCSLMKQLSPFASVSWRKRARFL